MSREDRSGGGEGAFVQYPLSPRFCCSAIRSVRGLTLGNFFYISARGSFGGDDGSCWALAGTLGYWEASSYWAGTQRHL